MQTTTKKRGRLVGSKKKSFEQKKIDELKDQITKYWDNYGLDEVGVDNAVGIDVPLHIRGGSFQWNFQKRMPWYDKVTWVLTAVNVGILITLAILNA